MNPNIISSQIIRQFQQMSKGTEARDFNVIQANFSYVQNWSIAQIVVVIICTLVQVNFSIKGHGIFFKTSLSGQFCQKSLQGSKRQ